MNESFFQTIFEQASEGIVLIDGASRYLLEANKAFAELVDYPDDLLFSLTLNDFIDLSPVGIEMLYRHVLAGKEPYIGELKCRRSDGTLIDVELRLSLLHFEGKELFCAFIRDLTMSRQVEKDLLETGGRFRQSVFSAPLPVMIHAEDGAAVLINSEWTRRTGYAFKDIPTIDAWVKKAFGAGSAPILEKFDFLYKTKAPGTYEEQSVITSSGEKLVWNFSSAPAGALPDGRRLFITMAMDVTASRCGEADLRSSLHEKDLLLREVSHRAKNNMQVVMSLLSLQSRYVGSPETQEFFKESQERVRAMVLIHDMLCDSSDQTRIDFNEYARSLVGSIISAYSPDQSSLQVEMRIGRIMTSLEIAVPCGLIIHELVSNSLKHGFPDTRKGTIGIDFDRDGAGLYTLVVSDNGIGLPKGLDTGTPGTLGLSLITTLTKQLQGVAEFIGTSGTVCRVSFRG